ncbi:ArsR/SmtB family transcription factor [Bacillus gaemokensis]|uniref:ArsR/SmtB family transcription factor n=1 Tax=Bacillus gaemokensis TaxID=574375 RepID=UPI000A85BE33|nr:metalloregulator ArsR/SmtB family transcription factor [Bacillus gaemokensis]
MYSDEVPKDLLRILQAISDETRLKMLRDLSFQSFCTQQLTERYSLTKSTVSNHLKMLESTGLIQKERKGYYYVVLTNKRLLLKGLDCYYKQVNEHEIQLGSIDEISQKEEEINVYGIRVKRTYIRLGSKEHWEELHEMMLLLKERGINKGKYNDFEKKFVIGVAIFVVVTQGLLLMKYIL